MSWLRTDDGFTSHPKFEGWKASEKWAFLELMHYCARYQTQGKVPADLGLLPRSITRKLLALAETSGWIDRDPQNRMVIHDWGIYNPKDPTAASRKQRQRERDQNRDTDRDETVTRAQARAVPVPSRPITTSQSVNPLLDQSENENGDGRTDQNQFGQTAEEQARIDAIDNWWRDDQPSAVIERDPYVEPFNDLQPLGEQLAAAKREEDA